MSAVTTLEAPPPARILMKGNEAMAEAAIAAGCDAYFGYPITPQAELLEWMARRMPEEGRAFVQAESELAAINMALGAAAAGARVLVSSSSPGISLMAEGMSYMAGSELPLLLINVMRGGPGLGSIGPGQADYWQATRGHGHGDYRVPVLAPMDIPEAVALVDMGFEIAERYRTPVMLLADGVLGQAMEPVEPIFRHLPPADTSDWAVSGARGRPPRVIKSLHLLPEELEAHNRHLQAKFDQIARNEVRWAAEACEDAEYLVVAYGTAARICASAVERARSMGLRVGLFRPITLWPFPGHELVTHARLARSVLVVELSSGQMVDDVRLSLAGACPVAFHGRTGGSLPTPDEILEALAGIVGAGPDDWGPDPMALVEATETPIHTPDEGTREPDPVSLLEEGAIWVSEHGTGEALAAEEALAAAAPGARGDARARGPRTSRPRTSRRDAMTDTQLAGTQAQPAMTQAQPATRVIFERPALLADRSTHYCPGCGHGVVHRLIAEVIEDLGLAERTIAVAPVGCAVFAYDYLSLDFVEAPHGRAPAVATGIRRVRPDAFVLTYQGDGDLAAIGTAEIVHAAARGERITTVFVNNGVYGMTGGQMAPTTLLGQRTTSTPMGRQRSMTGFPIRMTEMLALLPGVAYAARGSLADAAAIGRTRSYLRRACQAQLEGAGFAIVEVLANCPVGWGMTPPESMAWLKDRVVPEFPCGVLMDRCEQHT